MEISDAVTPPSAKTPNPTRIAIAGGDDRLEQQANDLLARRTLLERQAGDTSGIEAARQKLIHRYGPLKDLISLTKADQQGLLRVLIPLDSDYAIVVHKTEDIDLDDVGERWNVEFRGVLSVDGSKLKQAVLGGALAVP